MINNMYCKHCGKKVPEGSKFCRYCGRNLVEEGQATPDTVEKQSQIMNDKFEYAGFLVRLLAYCIDYSILLILMIVLVAIFGVDWPEDAYGLLFTAGYVIYSAFFLSVWSKTPGKALLKLVVLNEKDRTILTFGPSIKRSLLQILSTLFFGIGYWNMSSDIKKQTFHDKKSETVVLKKFGGNVFGYIVGFLAIVFVLFLMAYGYSE